LFHHPNQKSWSILAGVVMEGSAIPVRCWWGIIYINHLLLMSFHGMMKTDGKPVFSLIDTITPGSGFYDCCCGAA